MCMNREQIISALNEEIASLTSARDLLSTASPVVTTANPVAARGRGRPKGSTNKAISPSPDNDASKARRPLSAEGKARIAEAQRKRWAVLKKANKAKPASTKQSSAAKKVVSHKETAPAAAKKITTTSRKSVPKKAPAKKSAPPAAPATTGSGTE